MKRQAVSSSSIASVGYDESSNTLEIGFQNGRVYLYLQVPGIEFEGLMAAHSKGRYFNSRIAGRFDYRQIRGPHEREFN